MQIALDKILPNPEQPRSEFDDEALEALADTMARDGLLNPIAVTGPHQENGSGEWYVLVDGERRYRAAKLLGWATIEAHVQAEAPEGPDRLIRAMIGNLQRQDMGPVDEARAYARLRETLTVEEIAERVGFTTVTIYGRLKLLEGELADETLDLLNQGKLPLDLGALRALRRLPDEQQILVAQRAAMQGSTGGAIKAMCTRLANASPLQTRRSRKAANAGETIAPPFEVANVTLSDEYGDVVEAIIRVCDGCGMRAVSNGVVCRDCPLTGLVRRLARKEKAGDGQ
jgi:ParB/RepB/Spo0J family partition protein